MHYPTDRQFLLKRTRMRWMLFFGALSGLFFIPMGGDFIRKVTPEVLDTGHIIFFGMFTLVFMRFWEGPYRLKLIKAILLTFVLSLVIETVQSYVGRAFQLGDIYRNVLGTTLGGALYIMFVRTQPYQMVLATLLLGAVTGAIAADRIKLIEMSVSYLKPDTVLISQLESDNSTDKQAP